MERSRDVSARWARALVGLLVVAATMVGVAGPAAAAEGSWSSAGSLGTARFGDSAVLLPNGKVLVAGGLDNNIDPLPSTELYDPATNTWSPGGNMATARAFFTATLLGNGKVLVAGGSDGSEPVGSSELYNPTTNRWSPAASMTFARENQTATLLRSGKVLVAGGFNGHVLDYAELSTRSPITGPRPAR